MSQAAHIHGKVEYRQGEGAIRCIPRGPCEVQLSTLDATISWTGGEAPGSAALPIASYRTYVAQRVIRLDAPVARG